MIATRAERERRTAPLVLVIAAACLLMATIAAFVQPELLRLSGPLVCPSGYDHSEGYHVAEHHRGPERKADETTHLPSLRCYGRDGHVMVERVSAELAIPIVAVWIGALGVVVIGLPLRAIRRRRRR